MTFHRQSISGGGTALDRTRETYPVTGTLKHADLSAFQLTAGTSGCTIAEVEGPDNAADFNGLQLTAGQELVFGQQVTMIQLSAGDGVVYNSQERSAVWYVSSHAGSDNNTGLSSFSQFRTISKLMEYFIAAGDTVIEDDDSFWREELTISDDITVTRSNTGTNPPIHDAGDIAINSSFGLTSGQTNTYEIAWTPETGDGLADNRITVYEGGTGSEELLIYQTSIANVEANPGSYYVNGFANSNTGNTVYIHPKDSTNPILDNKQYTITKRASGIVGGDNCTVRGIECRRNVGNNGSLVLEYNATIEDCICKFGTKHNAFMRSGVVRRSQFLYNDDIATTSAALFACFDVDATGLTYEFEDCDFEGGNPANTTLPENTSSISCHSGTVFDNLADLVSITGGSMTKLTTTTTPDVERVVVSGVTIRNTQYLPSGSKVTETLGCDIEHPSTLPGTPRLGLTNNRTMTLRGNKIRNHMSSSLYVLISGPCTLTAENNTYDNVGGGSTSSWIQSASASNGSSFTVNSNNNVIDNAGFVYNLSSGNVTLNSDNNIFHREGANPTFALGGSFNGLTAWQTSNENAYDQNSLQVDPGIQTDFTTTAPEVDTLQAGVEYYST